MSTRTTNEQTNGNANVNRQIIRKIKRTHVYAKTNKFKQNNKPQNKYRWQKQQK